MSNHGVPFPADVQRITIFGDLPGGETWGTGFWIMGATPDSNEQANAQAELIAGACNSADPSGAARITKPIWGSTTHMKGVRVLAYTAGGTTADFQGEYLFPTPVAGTGVSYMPNQNAIVLTLHTAHAGRSYRGRMYLPFTTGGLLNNDGQFISATLDAIVEGWRLFFSDWNTSGVNGDIAVVSATKSHAQKVTHVSMNSRLDTQRRRAKSQAATKNVSGVLSA